MNIANVDDLEQTLDVELAWRLREISAVKSLVSTSTTTVMRGAALRAALPALYAHWEGFVKRTSELYIQHVFCQKLAVEDVKPAIAGYFLEPAYTGVGGYSTKFGAKNLVQFYRQNRNRRMKARGAVKVSTGSNLRYDVMERIADDLAVPDFMDIVDEKLINSRLCDKRNFIAHGQAVPVTDVELDHCRDEVTELMRSFKNRIVTAASNLEYLA